MDNRYVQQFKKGSLEMILLSLIGRKRGNDLPYSVSFAGSRVNPMPISPGSGKWRIKKILLPYP